MNPGPTTFLWKHWHIAAVVLLIIAYAALSILLFRTYAIREFPDSYEYEAVAHAPFFSTAFWEGIRPFTMPLLLKLSRYNLTTFAIIQLVLHLICWSALAVAVAQTFRKRWVKIAGAAIILAFALTVDVTLWNGTVLSESSSLSLFAALLAVALWCVRWFPRQEKVSAPFQIVLAVGISVLAVLWSFTRDANMYFLLGTAGVLLVALLSWRKTLRRLGISLILLIIMFGGIFLFQSASQTAGRRWEIPLINMLGQRILPFPAETAFFTERGMPLHPGVLCYTGNTASDCGMDFSGFEPWISRSGVQTYERYLLSHPTHFLLDPIRNTTELVSGDMAHYYPTARPEPQTFAGVPAPQWQNFLTRIFFPRDIVVVFLAVIALGLLVLSAVHRRLDIRWSVPLVLLLLAYPLFVVVWHGDAKEVQRHALMVDVQSILSFWLILLLAFDSHPSGRIDAPSHRGS